MAKSKGRGRKGPTPRKRPVPASVEENARYTAPMKARGPFRPLWHKVVGGLLVAAGVGVFVVNDLEWVGVSLMPGGHNELYAVLGVAIAASSLWWFGWLDRSPTRW